MRADRLISILLLLQKRGKITAGELAVELGVSERTIYRDVEALSLAGVPVYAERGPGGGIGLLLPYRTDLTGMKADEIEALSLLKIPAPLLDLGIGDALKTALIKINAALPPKGSTSAGGAPVEIHLDASWWGQSGSTSPFLQTLQQAVRDRRRVRIVNRVQYNLQIESDVDPLGLVAKTDQWYLVALRQGSPQVYRVSRLVGVALLPFGFERPPGFDLQAFWERYCETIEAERLSYWVTARVAPQLAVDLHWFLGEAAADILASASEAGEDGWITVRIPFETEGQAREKLLGMGGAVEVLEPAGLRKSVVDFAVQVLKRYHAGGNLALE